MESYRRSRSCNHGQLPPGESPAAPAKPPPLPRFYYYRSFSATSYSTGYSSKLIKEMAALAAAAPAPSSPSASMKGGSHVLSEPEFQRQKRVAGYKAFAAGRRTKGSLRKSLRWLKSRYSQILRRWR